MARQHWTPDDIAWDRFDASKVDPEILKVVKAASLVEYNGSDYATYLKNVFTDDPAFREVVDVWAEEEIQHGLVLARWAKLADPSFDHAAAFERFLDGYRLPLDAAESVRGSRSGELVARCIVEVGTSSHYSALGEACEEPVLREICKKIAADEFRHYKLFYTSLKRYLEREGIGRARRSLVALGRINESEDDELAYAYFAANNWPESGYDRKRCSRAYARRAFAYLAPKHVQRAMAMIFKAAGLAPQGRLAKLASRVAFRLLKSRQARLARAGA
jgi:rubrerythrin